jgi:predicted CXXCH cytochrome family protein
MVTRVGAFANRIEVQEQARSADRFADAEGCRTRFERAIAASPGYMRSDNSADRWRSCLAIVFSLAQATVGYADSAVCAACHPKIAEDFARTGMARSFRSVRADIMLPEFERGAFEHEGSQERFTALRRDGKYYVRRSQTGADGKPVNVREERADYVLGSGKDWMSYLHRTPDNQLVEFPVSWYAENGGHWGMSPGYDRPNHAGFSRQVFYRCMFCHNGYPATPTGPGDYDDATVFPAELPEGIDCQRCHGSGDDHIAAVRRGRAANIVRAAIVNPARLTAERQLDVCMQCHLETTQSPLPGALKRFNRGVFSYRPGEPLTDYIAYFDHAPGRGRDDKFELISGAYRLRKSACFAQSSGQMTCSSCHDPHGALSREQAQRKTNSACNACHQKTIEGLVRVGRHIVDADCASCHMPKRRPSTAIHIAVTDHLIQRPGASPAVPPVVEDHDGNTLSYVGEVAPYYPKVSDPLYAAIAQVKDLANLTSGLATLQQLLSSSRWKDAEPYFDFAEALVIAGQPAKAVPMYEQALKIEPRSWRYLYGMGRAWGADGKFDRAVEAYKQAIALGPGESNLLYGLAAAYDSSGRIPDAIRIYREVSRRNPEDAFALNNLGAALNRTGDAKGAEAAFREAIRLQPETMVFHMNLAGLLMRENKRSEAERELREAIRVGPSTLAEADLTLGSLLIAAGQPEQGKAHLKRALGSQDPRIRAAAARLLDQR